MGQMEFYVPRLFRTSSHVRFQGVVHEAPDAPPFQVKTPMVVYFDVNTTEKGRIKSQQRWHQDLQLLLTAQAKDPTHPRTAFYLAQTYECLNDIENAYKMYQVREKLNGWDEENFITLFRLGRLAQAKHPDNPALGWPIAMDYYLKAFSMRPTRIEPLIAIADYFWPNNIQACYLFARYAYDRPYPNNDVLFVEKEMYVYARYEIMSRCAWYMNEFVLGEQATRLALNARPNTPHLLRNLALYQEKIAENTAMLVPA